MRHFVYTNGDVYVNINNVFFLEKKVLTIGNVSVCFFKLNHSYNKYSRYATFCQIDVFSY